MRVLMLGWEFPPFIAGGLGTACHGLTKALDHMGHEVLFILPRTVENGLRTHVKLLSAIRTGMRLAPDGSPIGDAAASEQYRMPGLRRVVFRGVAAAFTSPYPSFFRADTAPDDAFGQPRETPPRGLEQPGVIGAVGPGAAAAYGADLAADADRYARLVVSLAQHESFDVIHAHDWLTYPAGLALARLSRKPLVVHVHSTEFDRSGERVNPAVYDIERRGMHGAQRIIAVSMFTKSICVSRYGVRPGKVDVVYNGIERESRQPRPEARIAQDDKIVLFLGRITMQKGPEYFVRAAARVLEVMGGVKFVVAGTGDLESAMQGEAARLGISDRVVFTGFLHGRDVERVFRMADCFVMPSVSEPFGITPLEAIRSGVPVIISKQSGVAEVLTHVLKIDFWDIDEMANKIVAVLRHPPLSATMREHGAVELRPLTWEGAAERCLRSYSRAADALPA
ncbi:MAG: glycosyltransferase [Phycisphaerales bacterium]|nr:glycosyltransferase [Phycisphaerales bacterium]